MGKHQLSEYLQMKFELTPMLTYTHIFFLYWASLQTQSVDSTGKSLNPAQNCMNGAVVGFSSQETMPFSIKFSQKQQEEITVQQDIWALQIIMYSKNCNSISMSFGW